MNSRNYGENHWKSNFRKPDLLNTERVHNGPPRLILDSMCRYCFEEGHWKKECPVLRNKQIRGKGSIRSQNVSSPVLLTDCFRPELYSAGKPFQVFPQDEGLTGLNPSYAPFVTDGFVSLPGEVRMYLLRSCVILVLQNHLF